MRILIDADGCPVVDIAVRAAKDSGIACHIFCDTAHIFEKDGAETHVLPQGADSADFALVNFALRGDIVITQDYGLASMALSRSTICINQDGDEYTDENIDALLLARHTARKIRNGGGRLKGLPKRTREQNIRFEKKLLEIIKRGL
ncbi:MAG: DUF188 domain-containing protein [Oscillospiraceae bacterium]|nr:DUF188 domain-containing protein [Oscillospiraceae bacterium]